MFLVGILAALAIALAVDPSGPADPAPAPADPPPSPAANSPYLSAASGAEALTGRWWDPRSHLFRKQLGQPATATIWGGMVHLFEVKNALAIAQPTAARKRKVRQFASTAERYWNPNLRPVGGYGPAPGERSPTAHTWFDDNGWWGIAFYDAYRATGDTRYLGSAKRALIFIDRSGWDRRGGIWWDTGHAFHAGESLATGTLLAASLYHETGSPQYLRMAQKYVRWADRRVLGGDGLYDRHDTDDTPMPYVQGPMANAFILLCKSTRDQHWCERAEALEARAAQRFPRLTMGPQYDAMYIRAILELYRYDGNRHWYDIAARETQRAMRNGRRSDGLYLNNWTGGPISEVRTKPNMLQTHAATTMVMAWMAATPPPH